MKILFWTAFLFASVVSTAQAKLSDLLADRTEDVDAQGGNCGFPLATNPLFKFSGINPGVCVDFFDPPGSLCFAGGGYTVLWYVNVGNMAGSAGSVQCCSQCVIDSKLAVLESDLGGCTIIDNNPSNCPGQGFAVVLRGSQDPAGARVLCCPEGD